MKLNAKLITLLAVATLGLLSIAATAVVGQPNWQKATASPNPARPGIAVTFTAKLVRKAPGRPAIPNAPYTFSIHWAGANAPAYQYPKPLFTNANGVGTVSLSVPAGTPAGNHGYEFLYKEDGDEYAEHGSLKIAR